MEPLTVVLVGTPNARAVLLQLNRILYDEGAFVAWQATDVADYAVLRTLFDFPETESLYLAGQFITIVLQPEAENGAPALAAVMRSGLIASWPAEDSPPLPPPNRYQEDISARAEYFRTHVLPATHQHGGGLYLLADKGTQLTLEAVGACRGCPYAPETVQKGILNPLRSQFPDLAQVYVQ